MEEFKKSLAKAKKHIKQHDKHQKNINRIINSYDKV